MHRAVAVPCRVLVCYWTAASELLLCLMITDTDCEHSQPLALISLTSFPLLKSQSCKTALAAKSGCSNTQFRKYDRPALRFSRNSVLNFAITDLGGSGGMAASWCGNARVSLRRKSSNSEYRLISFIGPDFCGRLADVP
jgi:hypothetical protein